MESLVQSMLSNAVAVTVLAALIAVVGRIWRRPAWIHSLCLLAMLKLVTPPLVPLAVPVPSWWRTPAPPVPMPAPEKLSATELDFDLELEMMAAGVLADLDDIFEGEPLADLPEADRSEAVVPSAWRWESWMMGLVLAGALAWWLLAAMRIIRFHRVLRDVEPMPSDWQAQLHDLAGRLALRRSPAVCLVPGEVPPMLWTVGKRPRLLLPSRLWSTLGEDQRAALVLHELAHLKRRDHWVRWIELVVAGLYWWHPVVWWIRRALREAEEQCCDAWVVWAMPRGAKTYATALVAALEYVSGARTRTVPAVAASATIGNGHVACMKRRLRMIVRAKTPQRLSLAGRLAIVALAALLLPLAPSWGQRDSSEEPFAPLDRAVREAGLEDRLKLEVANLDQELAKKKNELQELVEKGRGEPGTITEEQLNARIQEEFLRDPNVVALAAEITEAQRELTKVVRLVWQANDPARYAVEKHLKKLKEQWETAWEQKRDKIEKRLLTEDANLKPDVWKDKIAEIPLNIDNLKGKKASPAERLEHLRVETKAQKSNTRAATMLNQELASLLRMREIAQHTLTENQAKPTQAQTRQADKAFEARIAEELKNDPEVATLDRRIDEQKRRLDQELVRLRRVVRNVNADPVIQRLKAQLNESTEKSKDLRSSRRAVLLARLAADDDKDDKAKSNDGRETAERIEKQLKELVEKLGKEVSPVGAEVRKALERAVDEIHQSLQKEGMTPDDLRRAMEKSREELRKSFQRGGPVEKEMREAAERARKEMHETMERGRQESERVREEMRRQMEELTKQHRQMAEDARARRRQMGEDAQKGGRSSRPDQEREETKARERPREAMPKDARRAAREDVREANRNIAEALRKRGQSKAEQERDRPKAKGRPEAAEKSGDRSSRQELDAARQQIRELQEQLKSATRRLEELQGGESQQGRSMMRQMQEQMRGRMGGSEPPRRAAEPAKPARPAEPRRPETPRRAAEPARPARPAEPAKPARPAEPRRPETPARPATPAPRRENVQPGRDRDASERRLRDLEERMNRLLKELEELKRQKPEDAGNRPF
jgi:beta-lactamase regulating signal transducer with metallopeptidase domain